jgi:hypothetical protein
MTPERWAEIRDTWGNLPVVTELLAALDAANAEKAQLAAEVRNAIPDLTPWPWLEAAVARIEAQP